MCHLTRTYQKIILYLYKLKFFQASIFTHQTALNFEATMKAASLLPILLLAFINPKPLSATGDPQPLLDSNGDRVLAGTPYYAVTIYRGPAAGIVSLAGGSNYCPFDVILSTKLDRGQPLLISPATAVPGGIVYDSTDVNIKFSNVSEGICSETSFVWKVADYDTFWGAWFITTNGTEGNPGAYTVQNWFKFERFFGTKNVYYFVHCPKVCATCVTLCSEVGVFTTTRALALKPERDFLVFRLVKAEDYKLLLADSSSSSSSQLEL
ncbi:kunitz trypsin inhibitor 5-like [Mangifera indica]|uniref:kunitz trypsin inhibitor 5-like n=1 Tax=Mangifera indica TaxID=29780 RepID=UPI001CFBBDC6|nr:kunitz trypsin inhibitor 5-like [Mangifera indica]